MKIILVCVVAIFMAAPVRAAVAVEVNCPTQQSIRMCTFDSAQGRIAKQLPAEPACSGKAVLQAVQIVVLRVADKMALMQAAELLPHGNAGERLERPPRNLTV